MNYEFTFEFKDSDPFYITHHSNTLDSELLQFLIEIGLDFKNITSFKVEPLFLETRHFAIQFAQFIHWHKLNKEEIKDREYLSDLFDNFIEENDLLIKNY